MLKVLKEPVLKKPSYREPNVDQEALPFHQQRKLGRKNITHSPEEINSKKIPTPS